MTTSSRHAPRGRDPEPTLEPATAATESLAAGDAPHDGGPRQTRKLVAVAAEGESEPTAIAPRDSVRADSAQAPQADAATPEARAEPEPTAGEAQRAPIPTQPRKTTLAAALDRASGSRGPRPGPHPGTPAAERAESTPADLPDELPEEIPDEADEWSSADQPTVVLSPTVFRRARPSFLETGEHPSWPPRDVAATRPPLGSAAAPPAAPARAAALPQHPGAPQGPRLAAPSGRPAGPGSPMLSNPRMQRFQELRRQRVAHERGTRAAADAAPVAEVVRQWWSDLRPGLTRALHYQRAARASGLYPIPAHEPTPASRLGDAFGRLAASARDLTERATAAAGPYIKRLHDQAEQAAQALVEHFEGNAARQQGPLLGPGRIAVFFRPAVTVGQAQRLLTASQARPMRIIPRKHGFLALVRPGAEAEICERLRQHPYVRDVVFLEYDEYGDPIEPGASARKPGTVAR